MSELDNSQRPVSTDSVEVPIRVVDFPDYGVYRLPLIIEQVVDISVPLIRCKTYGGKVGFSIPSFLFTSRMSWEFSFNITILLLMFIFSH